MMKRLDNFYGDPRKVIECIMKEVTAPVGIREGDYKSLISFTDVLENNFNRLKCLSLEHEMSNTTTLSSVLIKFPRSVAEKWTERSMSLSDSDKFRPFPAFIEWLSTQKQIWEGVESLNISKCYQCGVGRPHLLPPRPHPLPHRHHRMQKHRCTKRRSSWLFRL